MKPDTKDFDDIVFDKENDWSQICPDCITRLEIDEQYLEDFGIGICGVKGCDNNHATVYINFPN